MSGLKTFFLALKRRKVINTVLPYVGVVWLLLQVVSVVVPLLTLPPLTGTFVAILLFVLFPVMLYLSWYFDLTSNGIMLTPADDSGTLTPLDWKNWMALCGIFVLSCSIGLSYFRQVRSNWQKLFNKAMIVILLPGEQLPLAQAEITRVDALLFSRLGLL